MDIQRPRRHGAPGLLEWVNRMGQPLYAYQAPTGFPDRAEAWVSTGSLLTRMNFGLHLASGRSCGVASISMRSTVGASRSRPRRARDLCRVDASRARSRRTVKRLAPLVRDPEVGARVERAAAEVDVRRAPGPAAMADDDAEPTR